MFQKHIFCGYMLPLSGVVRDGYLFTQENLAELSCDSAVGITHMPIFIFFFPSVSSWLTNSPEEVEYNLSPNEDSFLLLVGTF